MVGLHPSSEVEGLFYWRRHLFVHQLHYHMHEVTLELRYYYVLSITNYGFLSSNCKLFHKCKT